MARFAYLLFTLRAIRHFSCFSLMYDSAVRITPRLLIHATIPDLPGSLGSVRPFRVTVSTGCTLGFRASHSIGRSNGTPHNYPFFLVLPPSSPSYRFFKTSLNTPIQPSSTQLPVNYKKVAKELINYDTFEFDKDSVEVIGKVELCVIHHISIL